MNGCGIPCREIEFLINISSQVAEQLKAGGENNKAFEKILERLEGEARFYNSASDSDQYIRDGVCIAKRIVQEVEEEYNNGLITCIDRLPE